MSKIRVLSVDDSALMRQIMTEIINSHSDMEMVATAPDPLVARDLIKKFNPDVLTLDVEMPRMDGLDFLEKLMRLRPMPVVMVSSLTGKGSEVTLRALELGAIDFVTKPQLGIREGMLAYSEMIAEKVRTAARARIAAHKPVAAPATLKAGPLLSSEKLIAIGASTGGTEAIRHVLQPLPLSSPAVIITQHMPPGFTRSFAERLNKLCQISVKEAEDGERVLPGHAYIAPGDKHMELARSGANYQIKIHGWPAGKPASAFRGCAVSFGGETRGAQRRRRHSYGDGQRWRRWNVSDVPGWRLDHCAKRSKLCGVRHAARGHQYGWRKRSGRS
ncbi:protein-glutamate methylesterase [Salmonella enterica subsp. enterica]|nr:protein-glutamate methylesterase [Salmonella enterica subsp. enterica]